MEKKARTYDTFAILEFLLLEKGPEHETVVGVPKASLMDKSMIQHEQS